MCLIGIYVTNTYIDTKAKAIDQLIVKLVHVYNIIILLYLLNCRVQNDNKSIYL